MQNRELYSFIRESVSEIGKIPLASLEDGGNFQDQYEMDSLEAIEILHRIEKQYKIKIREAELEEIQSVTAIYNFCEKLIGNK